MSEQQSQDLKPAISTEHTHFYGEAAEVGAETAASERPSSEFYGERGSFARFQDLLLGTTWPAELRSPLGEWGGA